MECDGHLNFILIGDKEFALKEHMLKSFSQKSLNCKRRIYNYRLSRARSVVKNAFGF